jgi:aminoglycoside 6'-N-acetyltransferase I
MTRIQSATRDHADDWLRMRRELWPDGDDDHALEVAQYFRDGVSGLLEVLIAHDDDGRAIGFAELNIRPYAEGCETDRVAYLEGWFVDEHARRRGVGRALIDAAERWAAAQGCTEFASDALLENEISAKAHAALGFAEVERIRCFRKDLPR